MTDNLLPMTPLEDTEQLRKDVIRMCLRLREKGHFIGTWGNLGIRVVEGLLVTPTRLSYDLMCPADLVLVSWEGERLCGSRLPTSEMHIHRILLRSRPDLVVLIHGHSPWASSIACAGKTIPVISDDMAQILGGEVRCSRYVRGGIHLALAEAAKEAMGMHTAAVLLANHGVVVGGRDLEEAFTAALILEKSAQLFIMANSLGGCMTVPPQSVRDERERYLYSYGTAADAVIRESASDNNA